MVVVLLALCQISGSSVGLFDGIGGTASQSNSLLFGKSRAIRSDEYLVSTPTLISQDRNDEKTVNNHIGDGINFGFHYNLPTDNIFAIFKPATWVFFFTNNIEFSFSFFWWSRLALFIISIYLLLLELTNKNLFLSIIGSLLFYFTPFIQWWLPVDTIIPISFGIFLFIQLLKTNNPIHEILYGLGLTYCIISFAIIMYPPFQIPLVWITIFIAISLLFQRWPSLRNNKNKLFRLALILLSSILVTGLFIFLFFSMFRDVTQAMMNTSYPGSRFIPAGLGNINALLDGFFNILMQKDSNGALFGNQSEASNFFILFPFILPWVFYKTISNYKFTKTIDYLSIALSLVIIFFSTWYFLKLPDVFSQITGLYLALPQRLYIGFGFAEYLLILYMMSKKEFSLSFKSKLEIVMTVILVISTFFSYFAVGYHLFNNNPLSFSWPTIISPDLKILAVALLSSLLVFLIILRSKYSILLLLAYGIFSTAYVNPLYQGLDVLLETDMAVYIQEINEVTDKRWAIYGDNHYAQYVLANGGRILNGVHMYPQFNMWKILDPEKKFYEAYNRYAHVFLSDYIAGDEFVRLMQTDALEINISPCDERLKDLEVKYVLSIVEFQDNSCLELLKTFGNAKIYSIQE